MLPNCPINKTDVLNAGDILVSNPGSIEGKMTRTTSSKVILNAIDNLQSELLE